MSFKKLLIYIFFLIVFLFQNTCFSANFKLENIIIDNSDKTVLIQAKGNYEESSSNIYAPTPTANIVNSTLNNNLVTFSLTNPTRYVIDIPNSTIATQKTSYKINNSKIIQKIELFEQNNDTTRLVFTLNNSSDLAKFKTYSDGRNIIVKYNNNILDNSIQYKFYTTYGDTDKTSVAQNTYASTLSSNSQLEERKPKLENKYYLSLVNQNSDGLILRGIGEVSFQKIIYNSDNSKAEIILDNTSLLTSLENKTYYIPSSSNKKATLTISKINSKKIKLTLSGQNLRDYRAVISPDGQSIFVSHRTYVLNTAFAANSAKITSYNITKNSNGYYIFDINFDKAIAYDVFELNENFYLDIDNLENYNENLLKQALKKTDLNFQTLKIAPDKTRYIIPLKNLNFSYGKIESNSKSIKLCFKEKPQPAKTEVAVNNSQDNTTSKSQTTPIPSTKTESKKSENINVVYIPKQEQEDNSKIIYKESKKSTKKEPTISALKKVVLDPGHGGTDSGAIGAGVIQEKTLNLEIAKLVQEKLKKKNINVYMTRDKDVFISLEERTTFSNEISPDIYVSIHANSTVQDVSYGLETHYYKDDSLELANTVHSHFASEKNLKKWETKNRGVIKSRFYVINHTEAPSILIETGFISNAAEREKLMTKKRQEEIAEAIAQGIFDYLNVK